MICLAAAWRAPSCDGTSAFQVLDDYPGGPPSADDDNPGARNASMRSLRSSQALCARSVAASRRRPLAIYVLAPPAGSAVDSN